MTISSSLDQAPTTSSENSGVPVLVLGSGVTLTGVLRTLRRANIPCFAVSDVVDFASRSRWYRRLPSEFHGRPKPWQLASFLQTVPLERAMLLPCSDDWVRAVAALPDSLAERFPSSTAPLAAVDIMVDKWRFATWLERLGIPHPQTRLVRSAREMEALAEADFAGRFLKPLCSVEFSRKHGVKGFLVQNRAEAMRVTEYPILLQEYSPGPPTAGCFVEGFMDRNGRVRARFARRRLRMYPSRLGNSSLMVSVPVEELAEASATLDQLLQAVGYRGIFSAEFKYDLRDRRYKIIEVNARSWWYVEFAARCGVDVCQLAYRDALGLPLETVATYRVGRRCLHLANDFRAYCEQRKAGGMSLWSWIQPWLGAEDGLLRWNDPGPGIAYYSQCLKPQPTPTQERRAPTTAALPSNAVP